MTRTASGVQTKGLGISPEPFSSSCFHRLGEEDDVVRSVIARQTQGRAEGVNLIEGGYLSSFSETSGHAGHFVSKK
jgi:hypothetical protein